MGMQVVSRNDETNNDGSRSYMQETSCCRMDGWMKDQHANPLKTWDGSH
jgi:hypothetical protein